MYKITSGIFQINGSWGLSDVLGGNAFLLIDSKLTIVDAGYKGSPRSIFKCIKQVGFTQQEIENIIITHHHPDHISGLAELRKNTPAKVMVHADDVPYVNGSLPQPGPARPAWLKRIINPVRKLWATEPVDVDHVLEEGDILPILGGLEIIHTPGHTPGSIILHLPQRKLIIVGDLLTHKQKLKLPSKEFTTNLHQEINSIKKVVKLDFEIACFGHGPPILSDANSQIRAFLKTLSYLN